MTKARHGIYAAAISPITAEGALDVVRLVAYCQHLLGDGGCDGVAPNGTTGEGTSISVDERMALPAAFAEAEIAPDRVIFGTGNPAVRDAIRLSANAVHQGYPNVLVLPPHFYKGVSDDGLFAYYARIAEGVGDDRLRLYLYHFPQMSATPLSPALVARLRAAFGSMIAGLKDSSGDMAGSRAFVDAGGGLGEGFDVFPSSEALLFEALDAGCAGIISGSTNVFAPLVQAARRAGRDTPEFDLVRKARSFAEEFNLIAAMKYAEELRTGDAVWANLAPPLTALGRADAARFRTGLAQFVAVPT